MKPFTAQFQDFHLCFYYPHWKEGVATHKTHSGFLETLLDHTDHHPFDKVQWLVGIRWEQQRTLCMNMKDVRLHLSGSSFIKLKTNTFHNRKVHLLNTCSPSRTSATGSPLCWVETPDHRPHPSGTASSHEKIKTQLSAQSSLQKKTKQTKLKLCSTNTVSYLTDPFYVEVLSLAIEELFVLLKKEQLGRHKQLLHV